MCPCGKEDQTTEHIIYDCEKWKTEKCRLKAAVNNWPTSKRTLITRYYNGFPKYINLITFEVINAEKN